MHICVDGAGGGVVDVVEEDARDGDVGFGVALPGSVDTDIGGNGRVSAVREIRVDVSERLDVGVAVQLGDASDVVLVCGVAGRARAAVDVNNDLPLHFGVGGDGGGGVGPG